MPVVVPVTHNTTCGMTAAIGCAFFSYHLCDARFFSLFLGSFCYRCVNSFFLLSFFLSLFFFPGLLYLPFYYHHQDFRVLGPICTISYWENAAVFPALVAVAEDVLGQKDVTYIIVDATGPILFFPSTITIHLIGV